MPRTGLIASIAAALGVLALIIALPSLLAQRTAQQASALELDPGAITRLTYTLHTGKTLTLEQDARSIWILREEGLPDWPLAASQARGALRLIAGLQAISQAPASPFSNDAVTIEIATASSTTTLRIDPSPIAGRIRAQIDDERPIFIRADVAEALTDPGPRAWRSVAAIPLTIRDAARVRITDGAQTIALRSAAGRWSLEEPFNAPANPDAVARILDVISAISVDRFLDPPSGLAPAGADTPSLTIRVEDDVRIPDGDSVRIETVARTLEVGPRIGAEADRAFAHASTGADGARLPCVIDTEAIELLSLDPAPLVRPNATGVAPADVGMIVVQPDSGPAVALRRSLTGWDRVFEDGRRDAEDPAIADRWLDLLCRRFPDRIAPGDALDARPVAVVRLFDLADQPLDAVRLVALRDGRLAHDAGGFLRVYDIDATDAITTAAE